MCWLFCGVFCWVFFSGEGGLTGGQALAGWLSSGELGFAEAEQNAKSVNSGERRFTGADAAKIRKPFYATPPKPRPGKKKHSDHMPGCFFGWDYRNSKRIGQAEYRYRLACPITNENPTSINIMAARTHPFTKQPIKSLRFWKSFPRFVPRLPHTRAGW